MRHELALDEMDRVDAIRRDVDGLNLAGYMARAVNKPEDLRDAAHDISRAMKLAVQATDAMRDAEQATLRQMAKIHRIQRRTLRQRG